MSGIKIFRFSRWFFVAMLLSALVSMAWFGFRPPGGFKLADLKLPRLDTVVQTIASYSAAGSQGVLNRPAKTAVITPETVVVREYRYKWCGHTESGKAVKDMLLVGLTSEQLDRLYPASEGWEMNFDKPDRLVLRLSLEELCPICACKRHLGEIDGRVAIFIGPSSFQGALEKLTNIPTANLPPEWREQVRQGILEFGDSETLAQALDNLDEYY